MERGVSWKIAGGGILEPAPFFVMGVVNATPDSFYDGGRYDRLDAALERVRLVAAQGAHIIDIGGESTRPYADPVPVKEELARVLPVIKGAAAMKCGSRASKVKGAPMAVSIDTYKAEVADQAIKAGADVINDVSACEFDPELKDVLAQHKPGYVLMHSLGRPERMQVDPRYEDVVSEISLFFERKMSELCAAGLPEDRIVLDPGIGFGKRLEHNLAILKNLGAFLGFGRPLMVGLSNKSLWGDLLGLGPDQRRNATQIGTGLAAGKGARIHRVHEVDLTLQTLKIVESLT